MRAVITGSEGFVGRHIMRRLLRDRWSITPVDLRHPTAPLDARDWFSTNERSSIELLVHCAAVVGGRNLIEGSPGYLLAEDLSLDAALFRWIERAKPRIVVYFSSSAVYPTKLQTHDAGLSMSESMVDLDNVDSPDLSYGWAKLTGEQLARWHDGPTRIQVFRPFSGYGWDQALDYPFPSFIERAQRRADPFVVWGDGRQVRDWVHISDVVEAVMVGVEDGTPSPVNLCTGRPVSMVGLAEMVTDLAGYAPTIRPQPERPSGVEYRVGDPSLMGTFYEPKVSLEEGILDALQRSKGAAA